MSDKNTNIEFLKNKIDHFINEREWKQFHSPKNLSMSISIEASELMEIFQWSSLNDSEDIMKTKDLRQHAVEEVADILIYSIAFCNHNNIDISEAILQKIKKNIEKYPVSKYKGKF